MGDWKLIEFFEDGALELYNTAEDLSETKNLAKENPEKTKELQAAMLAWRKSVNAPVPTELNPEYASGSAVPSPKKPKRNKKKDGKKNP